MIIIIPHAVFYQLVGGCDVMTNFRINMPTIV